MILPTFCATICPSQWKKVRMKKSSHPKETALCKDINSGQENVIGMKDDCQIAGGPKETLLHYLQWMIIYVIFTCRLVKRWKRWWRTRYRGTTALIWMTVTTERLQMRGTMHKKRYLIVSNPEFLLSNAGYIYLNCILFIVICTH